MRRHLGALRAMGFNYRFVLSVSCFAIALLTCAKPVLAGAIDTTGIRYQTDSVSEDPARCDSSFQRRYYHPTKLNLSAISFPAPPSLEFHNTIRFEERAFTKNVAAKLGANSELKRIRLTDALVNLGYVVILVGSSNSQNQRSSFESLIIRASENCWSRFRASSASISTPPQQQLFQVMQMLNVN